MVWQTGSGTQSNMNVNEVIANRASELLGGGRGPLRKLSPNDHVNRSQSSNDVFSAAMNLASLQALRTRVLPSVALLAEALRQKAAAFAGVIKMGRTHLQDATPLTLGGRATILNVNVPNLPVGEVKGIKVTRLGNRHRSEAVIKAEDPRGLPVYWVGPAGPSQDAGPGTDFHAISEGYVSVTPLTVDLTNHAALDGLRTWFGPGA